MAVEVQFVAITYTRKCGEVSEWKLAVERVKDGKWCSVRSSAMSNVFIVPFTVISSALLNGYLQK